MTFQKPRAKAYEFSGAEFGEKNAGFIGGKTFQGGNRRTVPEFGKAEFWSFGTGRLHKAERFRCQNVGRDDMGATKALVGITGLWVKHSFPDAKAVMSTERSEWRHLEAVVKVLQMRTKHYHNCE